MTKEIRSILPDLVDIADVILIVLNPDETVAFINKKGCETLQYEPSEIIGKNYFDHFIEEEKRASLKAVFREIIGGNLDFSSTYQNPVLTKSGSVRLVQWKNSYQRDAEGRVVATISSGEDITKQVEEAAFARAVNERIADIIIVNDEQGNITYASGAVLKQLGYQPEELLGKSMIQLVHPEDQKEFADRFSEMLQLPGGLIFSRHRVQTAFGDYKWVEGESRNMLHEKPIRGCLNNFREIGERVALEERFRVLFEQSLNPIMIVGYKGIIECNGATVNILGVKSRGELIGKMPSHLSPMYQEDGMLSTEKALLVNNLIQEKGFHKFDWMHQNCQGVAFPVEVSVSLLPSLGNHIMLVTWHDLTERKTYEREVLEAKRKAEEASKAQEQFLSTMSHEIRTPLNAIIGFSHILLEEESAKDKAESLKALQFSSQHLLSLINDILDFNKIEAGALELEQRPFSLSALIKSIIGAMGHTVSGSVALKQFINLDVPDTIIGDETRLAQVLNNLVSNGLKFTHKGSVSLQVEVVHKRGEEVTLHFAVQDTGIGIPENKRFLIFNQFSQANTDTTRKYGGTGLGLSISKKLVELMGGTLGVESVVGKGSTFHFRLPFRFLSAGTLNDQPHLTVHASGALDLQVLVVEDNALNQMMVAKLLHKWQVEVDIAPDGYTAVQKCADRRYDVVLMDLQMPDLDGFKTTRLIRASGYTGVIFALTATALFDVKEEVLKSGMDDIICKPFKPQDLYAKLFEVKGRGGWTSKGY